MFLTSIFRPARSAFSDFIRYAFPLGNGVIRLKQNGYLKSFAFRGYDLSTSSWEELAARSERLSALLRSLDDQWVVSTDAFRVSAREYPEGGYWPDRLTYLLDQDRRMRYRAEGEHFETRYVVTFAYYPRKKRVSKFGQWFQDSPRSTAGSDEAEEASFAETLAEIVSSARGVFMQFTPLGSVSTVNSVGRAIVFDETCSFLSLCVRGRAQPIALIEDEPMFLDGIIGGDDVTTGFDLRINDKFVAVLVIEGFPGVSYPGILSTLAEQACEYRWNQRFVPMSPRQAMARLEWVAKAWGLVSLGGLGFITGGAGGKRDNVASDYKWDAKNAVERAGKGLMYGSYLSTIVLHAPDAATRDAVAERVKNTIQQIEGFVVRVEKENIMEAFIGSLPGERDANEYREARVSVRNAAHFFPLTAMWAGPTNHSNKRFGRNAPPLMWTTTNGLTPFRLHIPLHCLIIGKTGKGKSALLNEIIASHLARYKGARAWMFDSGYSSYKLCRGTGGSHYDVGIEDGPAMSPLSGISDPARRRSVLRWLEDDLLSLKLKLTSAQIRDLHLAVNTGAAVRGEDLTLSELAVMVQDEEVRQALEVYAGSFLDGRRDGLDFRAIERNGHAPFHVFEYGRIASSESYTTPFIQYVRRRIRESIREDCDEPGLVVFDEGHRALKIPNLEAFGEDMLREGRKFLLQMLFATQDASDAVESSIASILINLTSTKIFCPDLNAMTESNFKAYTSLGLKREEIMMLTEMEDFTYLYKSEEGTRVFTLEMSEFELAFLAGAGNTDKGTVDRLIASGERNWPARYLRLTAPALEPYARAFEDVIPGAPSHDDRPATLAG